MGFVVKDIYGQVLPGLPSPMLISVGGGEAYRVPPEKEWDGILPKRQSDDGFWRLREDKYDAPGIVYTRVRIGHTDQYYVLAMVHGLEDEPFPMDVWVDAESYSEARALGKAKVLDRLDENTGEKAEVNVMSVEKEG